MAKPPLPVIPALSIARPLREELALHPFEGRVLGCFERALNLADEAGRIVALTMPEIGNGPFSIVLAGKAGLFRSFSVGQPARVNRHALAIGGWRVDLHAAKIWEPRLDCPAQPPPFHSTVRHILEAYTRWPDWAETSPLLSQRLSQAAIQLTQAIIAVETEKMVNAAGQLAGLGPGLTPAGDDYLLGVMAALWLAGPRELLPQIAQTAAPQTTTLSAAFLKAAAQGEFIEPWHELVQALYSGEAAALSQAAARVAQFGASSGRDALAGFAAALLNGGEGERVK